MKKFLKIIILFIGVPFTYFSSFWLKCLIKKGYDKTTNKIFMKLGILPILDQYYQPMINPQKHLSKSLSDDRNLPGIDLNTEEQLDILRQFHYKDELLNFPMDKKNDTGYYYNNKSYEAGDAEYLYNIIRYFKPKRLIEIGSGNSTLMARNAIFKNEMEDSNYKCQHICIEPFEQPWLEKLNVELVRKKVENIDLSFFQKLDKNDILFIDSSHIIRPQGDVLYEYLELLPTLKSGVIIHIHDIFTPKDYRHDWIYKDHRLWNEQYLLEAFLTSNSNFKIIGALNYLIHNFRENIVEKCPVIEKQTGCEPGAFWLMKK